MAPIESSLGPLLERCKLERCVLARGVPAPRDPEELAPRVRFCCDCDARKVPQSMVDPTVRRSDVDPEVLRPSLIHI